MQDEVNPFEENEEMVGFTPGSGSDLSAFDDNFDVAEVSDFSDVPDGKYQVRIDKIELAKTQQQQLPMIKYDLIVIAGELTGRHIFKNAVITLKSLPYIKGDFVTLEFQLAKLSDFESRMSELLDKQLEITKKTKGENSNTYFNKLIKTPSGDTAAFGDTSGVF